MPSIARRGIELLHQEGPLETFRRGCVFSQNRIKTALDRSKAHVRAAVHWYRWKQSAPDPYTIRYIDPASISHVLAPGFYEELSRAGTHIKDGEWDQRIADEPLIYAGKYEDSFNKRMVVPFDNFVLYQSIVEWADHGVPWEETEFYQWALEDRKEDSWRFESPETVRDRFVELTNLYTKIKQEGYKTQAELDDSIETYPEEYDEVLINISRDGRFLLDDGRHRVCFARVLGVDTIPVRIFVRHKKWQRLRKKVATEGKSVLQDLSGVDSTHPDLQDII